MHEYVAPEVHFEVPFSSAIIIETYTHSISMKYGRNVTLIEIALFVCVVSFFLFKGGRGMGEVKASPLDP